MDGQRWFRLCLLCGKVYHGASSWGRKDDPLVRCAEVFRCEDSNLAQCPGVLPLLRVNADIELVESEFGIECREWSEVLRQETANLLLRMFPPPPYFPPVPSGTKSRYRKWRALEIMSRWEREYPGILRTMTAAEGCGFRG